MLFTFCNNHVRQEKCLNLKWISPSLTRTHQSEYIQDFHGPHRSPEEQFQTNLSKASFNHTITPIKRKKFKIFWLRTEWSLKSFESPPPRMFLAKFRLNLPIGSCEEVENVKSLQTDRKTDDVVLSIRKAHLSF